MPILLLWKAYAWFGTGKAFLMPLLAKIPWQVWAGIAATIAVLYYGHVREARGVAKCQAQVKIATDREIGRQKQVSDTVVREAQERAKIASDKELEATNEAGKLQLEVDRLKNAKTVCLPSSITKRYRN